MKALHASLLLFVLAGPVAVAAEKCKPGDVSGAPKTLVDFGAAFFALNPPCGSAKTVLDKLVNHKRIGGRKLEEDKPYDPRAAQADLDKALADADVRKRFDEVRSVADENARLAFEAAVLDDEGYYAARELKIRQLLQRLQ